MPSFSTPQVVKPERKIEQPHNHSNGRVSDLRGVRKVEHKPVDVSYADKELTASLTPILISSSIK